jgi:competence protein ComEA
MHEFIEKNKIFIIAGVIFTLFTFFSSEKEGSEIIINEVNEDNEVWEKKEIIEEKIKIFVHVAGNVGKPGLYEINEGSRLNDLIIPAEITKIEILDKYFNRAQILSDGEKIYIPFPEEIEEENSEKQSFLNQNDSGKVNINLASLSELVSLPGIGEAKARDIIDFREKNGKFKIIDDIMMVKGIGTATFERIKELIKT